MARILWLSVGVLMTAVGNAYSQDKSPIQVEVAGGKTEQRAVPICVPLNLPELWAKVEEVALDLQLGDEKKSLTGQLTAPGLRTASAPQEKNLIRRDLHVVIPVLPAGKIVTLTLRFDRKQPSVPGFVWTGIRGEFEELVFSLSGRWIPVLRYMSRPYDDTSKNARNRSYKVFHHLYDPDGKRFVTNGGHTDSFDDEKQLLYPHHRGLQMGFNQCIYEGGKKRADTWHCQKDDHQAHEKSLAAEAGPVLGRHRVAIAWHGPGKQAFVQEERELTVFKVPGGTLVEFTSRLKPVGGAVKLDGDPQHAGFQFRAHNDVAKKTAKQTYYLRPDGKGELGATRNWEPKTKEGPINLPWNAMSFVLDGKRYTVCYLDHPDNPGEKRHSERDYGRFGCYFEHELTEARPLVVNYRIWLQEGEMTIEQVAALAAQFANPPKVTVK